MSPFLTILTFLLFNFWWIFAQVTVTHESNFISSRRSSEQTALFFWIFASQFSHKHFALLSFLQRNELKRKKMCLLGKCLFWQQFLLIICKKKRCGERWLAPNHSSIKTISLRLLNKTTCCCVAAYESLQSRKEIRETAWQRPGWDECVAHTGQCSVGQRPAQCVRCVHCVWWWWWWGSVWAGTVHCRTVNGVNHMA